MSWLWTNTGAGEPAWNMAFDEALLEHAKNFAAPLLRLYSWTEPAATFGYFQHYADIAAWTPLRPLIRRPTGGGLAPHDADWTYSLAVPPHDPWYQLRAVDSYRQIHELLARAFRSLGVDAQLAPEPIKDLPGQCFRGAEQYDLLVNGKKIAGAAQRRTKDGLLIQGSIQPRNLAVTKMQFETALVVADWMSWTPPIGFVDRVRELADSKYSKDSFNQKR